jgi:hypothetical protein
MRQILATAVIGVSVWCGALEAQVAKKVDPATIPDSQYVQAKDGHLVLDGKPVRFWAVIGGVYRSTDSKASDKAAAVAEAHKGTDALVQRYIDLGFNANRLWRGFNKPTDYTPGDGSAADDLDYFVYRMKERGLKIWMAGMGGQAGSPEAADVDLVNDPATAEAWKAAIAEAVKGKTSLGLARTWDPRVEAACIRNMKNVATHFNHYTGLRWCDDPVFVVWELSNEEWWMRRMLGGGWQKLPAFFRNSLVAKWNDFLKTKYGSNDKLKEAWKELLPGEDLSSGTVLLAPMTGATKTAISINDASEQAKAALEGMKQEYSRGDFAPARQSDVIEFLLGLQIAHKQRERDAIKPLGKSTKLSPMIFDTGIGYEIQSQYLHQQADAVAHDAYVNGTGPQFKEPDLSKLTVESTKANAILGAERVSANEGRWVNWLLKPPGICQGVPWIEQNRIEGKPYFVYEIQIQQPAKYRTDFPLRVGALASIQEFDFICWHYFATPGDVGTNPNAFDKPMDITTGTHPQGYHYTFDEVQNATMRAAAFMWRQNLLAAAPKPTKFIFGRKALYDGDSMEYAGSYGMGGMDMLQTVYQYGVRIEIDPKREDNQVIGPVVKFENRNTHNPYMPTDQIVFDWKKGYLSCDAPGAMAWTGKIAQNGEQVAFKNGATLSGVTIDNPPGIYEAIKPDEKFIAFALYSTDGRPLETSQSAALSLVSTSFNTGFKLGTGPNDRTQGGKLPVLVARVGGKVTCAALNGMKYVFKDWHMNVVGEGKVAGGTLTIPSDKPVFVVELTR